MRLRHEAGVMPVVFVVSAGVGSPDMSSVTTPTEGRKMASLPAPATMHHHVSGVAYPGAGTVDELQQFLAGRQEGVLVIEWGALDGTPLSDTVFALSNNAPAGADKDNPQATCDPELLGLAVQLLRTELRKLGAPDLIRVNDDRHPPSVITPKYQTWQGNPSPAPSVQAFRLLFNRELYELLRPASTIDATHAAQLLLSVVVERALTNVLAEYAQRQARA